jgi:CelD/BcsL family acetyltransferase involved in cellulose biosynthesis
MKVTLIPGSELSQDLEGVWLKCQRANPTLTSPYFHPEFTRAIAAVRTDVEIAIVEEGNRLVALFPFQRHRRDVGIPVGGIISDYHGLICAEQYRCDLREIIRLSRLAIFDFEHCPITQLSFTPFHRYLASSPQIDLSDGYQAYFKARSAVRSEQIKLRRIEREVGPLRFVAHDASDAGLRQVLAWKSKQYTNTGKRDLFKMPWIRAAVERIRTTEEREFSGMVSLLYAGERLIAGHLGMRGQFVWHWWFPSYDPEMARYSPGIILLIKMVQHASQMGIRTIDLGAGTSSYKRRFMNASIPLASGSVELASWRSSRRNARRSIRGLWQNLKLGAR